MPRTIEERLQEILEALDNIVPPAPIAVVNTYHLVNTLVADFRAEGIAGRTIKENSSSPTKVR